MSERPISPERITKPIQLLAAWLAGLLSVDTCFLVSAYHLEQGSWESMALTVAAILNVPLFLAAVFLLQTKFRPELQEDRYYSTYLNRKTNEPMKVDIDSAQIAELRQEVGVLGRTISESNNKMTPLGDISLADLKFGINRFLSDKAKIHEHLARYGVLGTTVFGTDEPPTNRVVAISEFLPDTVAKTIVMLARDLGFSNYTIYDNKAEGTEEDVLFGSYGDGEFEIVKTADAN